MALAFVLEWARGLDAAHEDRRRDWSLSSAGSPLPNRLQPREPPEALAIYSQELIDEVGERLLTLLKMGMPDEAATPTIGLLVGLLRAGGYAAADGAAALRVLASRGTHGDSIREAGGIPLLLQMIEDAGADADASEDSIGAIAHLMMQRAANREVCYACNGVPLLAALLAETDSQAAEYAASSLGALVICGAPPAVQAVRAAVGVLPPGVLASFPNLEAVLSGSAVGAGQTGGASAMALASAAPRNTRWWRWLRRPHRWLGGSEDDFLCPILHDRMSDPVVASDGMSYEREAIREVIDRGNGLSPLTREPLAREVYPNFQLRRRLANSQEGAHPPGRVADGLALSAVATALAITLTSALVAARLLSQPCGPCDPAVPWAVLAQVEMPRVVWPLGWMRGYRPYF